MLRNLASMHSDSFMPNPSTFSELPLQAYPIQAYIRYKHMRGRHIFVTKRFLLFRLVTTYMLKTEVLLCLEATAELSKLIDMSTPVACLPIVNTLLSSFQTEATANITELQNALKRKKRIESPKNIVTYVQRKITDPLNNRPNYYLKPPPPPPALFCNSLAFLHSILIISYTIYLWFCVFSQYKHMESCPDDMLVTGVYCMAKIPLCYSLNMPQAMHSTHTISWLWLAANRHWVAGALRGGELVSSPSPSSKMYTGPELVAGTVFI